jgi:hypothetical protein
MKYFAFGSNINYEQMRRRLEFLGRIYPGVPFILKDYKLIFDAGYKYADQTFANIIFSKDSEVHGLLYDINERQLKQLELHEMLYDKKFFRLDDKTQVYTFVAREVNRVSGPNKKPFLSYLNTIIEGAEKAGLNKLYNQLIEYKEKNYKLKKGNKHKRK